MEEVETSFNEVGSMGSGKRQWKTMSLLWPTGVSVRSEVKKVKMKVTVAMILRRKRGQGFD